MPTYQYACNDCGHDFEAFQSFSDDALTICPECKGQLRKVFSAVGVVFKGSGFYRNDSRGKTSTVAPAAKDAGSGGGSESSSSSSSADGGSSGTSSGGTSEGGASTPAAPTKSTAKPSTSTTGSSSASS